MSSKYAIALYELVQLRADMDRCIEQFALAFVTCWEKLGRMARLRGKLKSVAE